MKNHCPGKSFNVLVIAFFFLIGCSGSGDNADFDSSKDPDRGQAETKKGVLKASDSPADVKPESTKKPKIVASPSEVRYGKLALPPVKRPASVTPLKDGSVLLVVVDAFNANHLSSYGYKRQTTPNIDALAQDGILFTNWVSNSSWTRPSFTSIITGLWKQQHMVELTGQNLERKIVTMAEMFQNAGYRTAGFVGNPLVRKLWAFDQGFATYEDTKDHKAFPRARILVDKALAWLRKTRKKPFFVMLFLTDPHTPYRPPGEFIKYLDEIGAKKNIQYPFKEYKEPLPQGEHDAIVAAYDGEVAYADSQIGRLLDGMKAMGKLENTTVVVTADHGEIFGEHNSYLHGYHAWEPVLKVPCVISSPAFSTRGVIDDSPRTHVDLLPTLAELNGIEVPKNKPGISVLTDLSRKRVDENRRLFSQYNAHGIRRQATRLGRWKLIHHHKVDKKEVQKLGDLSRNIPRADPKDLPSIAVDKERYELYDLVEDPGELNNVYEKKRNEPIVATLKEIFEYYRFDADGKKTAIELSEETLEALRAAGYIQ